MHRTEPPIIHPAHLKGSSCNSSSQKVLIFFLSTSFLEDQAKWKV